MKEKKSFRVFFLLAFSFAIFLFFFSGHSLAITSEECMKKVGKEDLSSTDLAQCEALLDELYQQAGNQKRTLQSELGRLDSAIKITAAKIASTNKDIAKLEGQIAELTDKIAKLDISLNRISEILIKRIGETYKRAKNNPLTIFLSSHGFSEFVGRYKYLRVTQAHDRELLLQMETARTNYEDQKKLKEKKQEELKDLQEKLTRQKALLAQQKADRERLLTETKSNELRYQQLLAETRAELEAIQAIVAGQGDESPAGNVNQGDHVALIIRGASACSTGTHLHFEIRDGEIVKNPLSYLRNVDLIDYSGGDPRSGSGDWDWPLSQPIRFNQGFGEGTSAIRSGVVWYKFHTGIDLNADDLGVKAVKSGALYRGVVACGGGMLRYVHVKHDGSNLNTYYLHVNY